MSSALTSLKADTRRMTSSTTLPDGPSLDMIRIPVATDPAATEELRGGDASIATVPEVPGRRDKETGVNVTHGAAAPRASKSYRSTTAPLLWTSMVVDLVRPGSTTIAGSARCAIAPIRL